MTKHSIQNKPNFIISFVQSIITLHMLRKARVTFLWIKVWFLLFILRPVTIYH